MSRRGTKLYRAWRGMIDRCENRNVRAFPYYGGRGIRVSPKWRHDFDAFARDVGEAPTPDHWLDRIDSDGHYEPGNVRWATVKEQQRNRRSCVLLTIRGETKTVAEWAEVASVPYEAIRKRLRRGWSHEDAVFVRPLDKSVRRADGTFLRASAEVAS